uniref:Uncharacterized protein n=1 Tax=Mycena chlorophos TaxID=658473 RepID=A0ABQ0L338_MYCCL|nr:predicted protein [Mycena chlorophos]
MEMSDVDATNRARLISLLGSIPNGRCPEGWRLAGCFAIGGLTDIGFSKNADLLLVLSGSGRGVIDPKTGAVVARDDASDGDWLNERLLTCEGIGPLAGEEVQLAGLSGGGLPHGSGRGESLEVVSPNWPLGDLIFCSNFGSALVERFQSTCLRVASDHIRAFGFSWSGNSFVYATGSDVHVYVRLKTEVAG